MPLAAIRQARTGKALFWCCVQETWGLLAAGVPGTSQQIMPAGVAPCAGQLADMTRDINSRVAKVDKNGNWLKSWGERGKEPGQFNTPHSIATDASGNVYVADRGNRRIQVFDGAGKFLRQFTIDV